MENVNDHIKYVYLGVALVSLLLAVLAKRRRSQPRGHSLRLPPGPWQLPLIGSQHHIAWQWQPPHRAMRNVARRHGRVMLLHIGEVPTLVVSSRDAAREVMRTHDAAFASRPLGATFRALTKGGRGIIFAPYGGPLAPAPQARRHGARSEPSFRKKSLLGIRSRRLRKLTRLGSVPTTYPMNLYSRVCMIDTLQKMGISHRFSCEIKNVLDMIYRSWLKNDEEIFEDMETCAMAFRILRVHEYDVSSDKLSHFAEESRFHYSIQGNVNDTKTLLELYKVSHARILENERSLESIGFWTSKLLKQQLC